MQPTSEKCSYLEELSCKEKALKENRFCFNQNQDKYHPGLSYFFNPPPLLKLQNSAEFVLFFPIN